MSLVRRAWAMIEAGVPLDRAEQELRARQAELERENDLTPAERMRRDKRTLARSISVTSDVARYARLVRRMGWDLAPPVDPPPKGDDDAA